MALMKDKVMDEKMRQLAAYLADDDASAIERDARPGDRLANMSFLKRIHGALELTEPKQSHSKVIQTSGRIVLIGQVGENLRCS